MGKLAKLLVLVAFFHVCTASADPTSIATSLLLHFLSIAPSEVVVTTEGSGSSQEEALSNAIHRSVQQVAGVTVVGEQHISDDQLVSNTGADYSGGMVSHYDILACYQADSLYKCKIKARVSTKAITHSLEGSSNEKLVSGQDLYGDYVSNAARALQGQKLVKFIISDFHRSAIDLNIVKVKTVQTAKDIPQIQILVNATMNPDYMKSLDQIFSKLQDDTRQIPLASYSSFIGICLVGRDVTRYDIKDNGLISQAVSQGLGHQPFLEIATIALSSSGDQILSRCTKITSPFSRNRVNLAPGASSPFIIDARAQSYVIMLAVSLENLQKISTIKVVVGCENLPPDDSEEIHMIKYDPRMHF